MAAKRSGESSTAKKSRGRRRRGSGGVTADSDGVWRVDVEVARDAVTGKRRRVSRTVRGTRQDAEIMAAKLKLADHEQRLVTGKTNARSVSAVLEQYVLALESGAIEVAPSTVVTSRSAIKTMSATQVGDGREFGSLPLSQLGWREIEQLYAALKTNETSESGTQSDMPPAPKPTKSDQPVDDPSRH